MASTYTTEKGMDVAVYHSLLPEKSGARSWKHSRKHTLSCEPDKCNAASIRNKSQFRHGSWEIKLFQLVCSYYPDIVKFISIGTRMEVKIIVRKNWRVEKIITVRTLTSRIQIAPTANNDKNQWVYRNLREANCHWRDVPGGSARCWGSGRRLRNRSRTSWKWLKFIFPCKRRCA